MSEDKRLVQTRSLDDTKMITYQRMEQGRSLPTLYGQVPKAGTDEIIGQYENDHGRKTETVEIFANMI